MSIVEVNRMWTIPEIAHKLQMSATHVYDLVRRREIGCVRIGRSVRVPDDDLKAFVNRNHTPATDN